MKSLQTEFTKTYVARPRKQVSQVLLGAFLTLYWTLAMEYKEAVHCFLLLIMAKPR